jgi:ubiquinone/menaquinone biosynthesis C-methylase UbiE
MDDRKLTRAASFERAAAEYDRGRPIYPPEAVEWMLPAGVRDALDLGAGTGKFTGLLAVRELRVTAVDPSPAMLERLRASVPGVSTLEGTAERIPMPDSSVDVVTSAQAWHWVDETLAFPEVARVLRPGGTLALVWNFRSNNEGWRGEFARIIDDRVESEELARVLAGATPSQFEEFQHEAFPWTQTVDRDRLLDLVASRSVFITASDEERASVLARVSHLLDTHPELRGRTFYDLDYRAHAFRARKRE